MLRHYVPGLSNGHAKNPEIKMLAKFFRSKTAKLNASYHLDAAKMQNVLKLLLIGLLLMQQNIMLYIICNSNISPNNELLQGHYW